MKPFFLLLLMYCAAGIFAAEPAGQTVNMSQAVIFFPETADPIIKKAAMVLQEEAETRSGIRMPLTHRWPSRGLVFAISLEDDQAGLPQYYREIITRMPEIRSEGYKITVRAADQVVVVAGHDSRGALYGVGKLLRKMEISAGQIRVPQNLSIATSPAYPIRGHQLGYRPKTNSYDAWTPEQFDRYIRDLAIFGANSIEIMPPRTDDDFTSIHMKMSAIDMIVRQSAICDSYDMDVWMWYPNLGEDYTDDSTLTAEMAERRVVFSKIPRLDHLFVPGGDPGDVEPDVLFGWLGKVAEVLHEYHPEAKIWVSPQVFRPTKVWFDAFYGHVNRRYHWFGGVVFGPWVKTPIAEIRRIVHPGIPIRRYPDITHSLSCQYPVPQWDLAWAVTLGRECINPRPEDQKIIHNAFDELAQGSISYSEGTNDDVNKFIWSDQDWDPEIQVIETLRDYARYFTGASLTESVAQGLLALEENLRGPLLSHEKVMTTLYQWQEIEKKAPPAVLSNFRFQMGLLRAYYDAYVYRRLVRETEQEQQALELLALAPVTGSAQAINRARGILLDAHKNKVTPHLRERCYALADSLYKSIGAQLTVEKHHAMEGRGNFIDNIDLPLNNAFWLLDQLAAMEKLSNEEEKQAAIHNVLHRNDPGPGGFYDNFGNPASWKRVISKYSYAQDPGGLSSPRVSFGIGLAGQEWVHEVTAKGFEGQACPVSWMNQVTALYDQPLEIRYDDLDPEATYLIRVAYTGRFRAKMKMDADQIPVHDFIQTGIQPIYEFDVPAKATADGQVTFTWNCGEGERGSQVSEIWMIRKTSN